MWGGSGHSRRLTSQKEGDWRACLEAGRVPAPDGGVEEAGAAQQALPHAQHLACVWHLGGPLHQCAQRSIPVMVTKDLVTEDGATLHKSIIHHGA